MSFAEEFLYDWAEVCVREVGKSLPVNHLSYDTMEDCFYVGYEVDDDDPHPLEVLRPPPVRQLVIRYNRAELIYHG